MKHLKKVTQRDRYGNQVSYEFESPMKPVDPTRLMEKQMEDGVPQLRVPPMPYDHPGEPRGTDTVPAWLTPGEFVVNREAMSDPENAATVEAINNEGRAMQAYGGGSVPPNHHRMPSGELMHNSQHPQQADYYAWGDWVSGFGNWFNKQDPRTIAEGVPNVMDKGMQAYDMVSPFLISDSGRGYGAAMQDAYDIEDPNADLSSAWVPPVVEDTGGYDAGDAALMENYEMLQPAPLEDPYAEAQIPTPEGIDWDQRAVESLTEGRGLVGQLIPPSGIEIAEERERLIKAAASADERETVELDSSEAQAEAEIAAQTATINPSPENIAAADEAQAKVAEIEENKAVVASAKNELGIETPKTGEEAVLDGSFQSLVEAEVAKDGDNDGSNPSTGGNAAGAEAASKGASKQQKEEATGLMQSIFGDLFNKSELKRMGLMYLGSRLMGYSHGGSLQWAANNYIERVDAGIDARQEFIKDNTDTYTTKSLAAYRKSGDLNDLVPKGLEYTPQGEFKYVYNKKTGQRVQVQKAKGSDDGVYWVDSNNDPVPLGAGWTDDKALIPKTPEYNNRITADSKVYASWIKDFNNKDVNKWESGSPKLNWTEGIEGRKIADWAIRNDVDINDMGRVVENAMNDAIIFQGDQQQHDAKISQADLEGFLNDAWIKSNIGNPDVFRKEAGKRTVPIRNVIPSIDNAVLLLQNRAVDPQKKAEYASMDKNDLRTMVVDSFITEWDNLSDQAREIYGNKANKDETGFIKFMQHRIDQLATQFPGR